MSGTTTYSFTLSNYQTDYLQGGEATFEVIFSMRRQLKLNITDLGLAQRVSSDPRLVDIEHPDQHVHGVTFTVKRVDQIVLLQNRSSLLFDLIPESRMHYFQLLQQASFAEHGNIILSQILKNNWNLEDINFVGIPFNMPLERVATLLPDVEKELLYPQVDTVTSSRPHEIEFILTFRDGWLVHLEKIPYRNWVHFENPTKDVVLSLYSTSINSDYARLLSPYRDWIDLSKISVRVLTLLNSISTFEFEQPALSSAFNRVWVYDRLDFVGTRTSLLLSN